ncbi:MAG: CcmD family protein [Desulfovibrionaceae bacterium]|jgi:CcmD family protein|nr:CcmD family protein [Desulfovibrionaceae bacterium]
MNDAQGYLLAANVVVWVGVGAYLALLAVKNRRIENRIRQMEMIRRDRDQ